MRVDVAAIEAVQERLREKRSRGGGVGGETLRDEVQQLYGTYLRMIYICDGLDTWSKVLVSHIYIYISAYPVNSYSVEPKDVGILHDCAQPHRPVT